MKGWFDRSISSIGRAEKFVKFINSEPGDHPFPNLFLCSSNFENGKK